MNSIPITLISLFIAGSVSAAETVKFVSLDACKVYYAKLSPKPVGQTDAVYCKDKIMGFVEACTATELSKYITANKLKSLEDLTDTEQRNLKTKYSYQCQVTFQAETAAAAQKKAASASSSSGGSGSSGGSKGMNSAEKAATTIAVVGALTPLATNLADSIEKKQKAAEAASTGASASGGAVTKSTATEVSAENPARVMSSEQRQEAVGQMKIEANSTEAFPDAAQGQTAAPSSKDYTLDLSPEAFERSIQEAAVAKDKLASEAAAVKSVDPKLADKADNLTSRADSSASSAPATDISAQAQKATSELEQNVATAMQSSTKLAAGGAAPPFSKTMALLNENQANIKKYYTQKETCKNAAEKASYLCVEGTSPGSIAAKELMNAAGPVLAIISSAQRACSSTAKITKMVNTGLLVAKGVCVGAKLYCGVSCKKSSVDIKQISTTFQAKYEAATKADYGVAKAACTAQNVVSQACIADLAAKAAAAQALGPQMNAALHSESSIKSGTSAAIDLKCTSMAKDVVLLGIQAAGTYAAHQNAKSCEQKLASSGASAAAVTTQQYCEKSENVSTQLCVCQKNPMAQDCPGAVLTDAGKPTNSSADTGTNIKALGGNSGFAGGFGAGPKKGAPENINLGKDNLDKAISDDAAANGADGNGFAGGGDVGGSGGGLGSAPGGSDAAAAAAKKEAEDKKKWAFGAFQSESASGSLGFNVASSANKFGKSGALNAQDQMAIRRQIASEKYAAEVSNASGKSNWEKVRNMYLIKENSFIFGQ